MIGRSGSMGDSVRSASQSSRTGMCRGFNVCFVVSCIICIGLSRDQDTGTLGAARFQRPMGVGGVGQTESLVHLDFDCPAQHDVDEIMCPRNKLGAAAYEPGESRAGDAEGPHLVECEE